MTKVMKKPSWLCFFLLTSLILLSNFTLYRLPLFGPVPDGAVLGSLLDLLVIVPLITYFLIIRKRYSLKYLGIVILAGYGAAYFIIPGQYLSQYSFLPYLVLLSEMLFLCLELYIAYKVITNLPRLLKEYRKLASIHSFFLFNAQKAVEKHLPSNRLATVLVTEFAMFNYALFSWRKRASIKHGKAFTYHQKTSVNAVYIMLIHAIVIESIGLHYWLHSWSPLIAYISIFLNIYGLLYFLAEIHATRLTPFVISDSHLLLQTGFSKSMNLPLEKIKEIKYYDGPEKFSGKELKDLYDARVPDFIQEKPMFEITLSELEEIHLMYGLKRRASRVVLNVDEPEKFYQEMMNKLKHN
ncbi:hypothetical protein J7I93_14810 [Bacillus sp. ISL-47]|uniref:hypothetical protein n=1 Tax=Bacillus sp. ISL-47 TaxID=2819130 RepID=UPI001BEA602A|nr:hypothetical protein [Bacillus sp. ISL-47]MBT2689461.1 hypothetical protein [Bacillus sp. ISL-47]MBT2708277.1 hypothetical protein [Pseudomonas sp. ISL-84]